MPQIFNNISKMRNFFENQSGIFKAAANADAAAIYAYLCENGHPFDRAAYLHFTKKYFKNRDLLAKVPTGEPLDLLPIEFFKTEQLLQHFGSRQLPITTTFHSSGTSKQNQSSSPFSNLGMRLYRSGALSSFFSILENMFPIQAGADQGYPIGFSLIPERHVWTTSSLAQMVSWIDDESGIKYADEENFFQQLAGPIGTNQPVWIFGTAFHFVNLIDRGFEVRLPKNSLIIDTGGTKGKSRSVERSELFTMLEHAFSTPTDRIISEYGMSELSAQAYDCGPGNLADRTYKFPAWVEIKVLTGRNRLEDTGSGALVVYDPLRIDLPFPIRTEDIVDLDQNKFQIRRRSRSAPLKGCSLLAEQPQSPGKMTLPLPENKWTTSGPPIERAFVVKAIFEDLLGDSAVHAAFAEEFGSATFADFVTADLRHSLDLSGEELAQAAQYAIPDSARETTWTILAPNNHSIAAIHPILLAFIGGLKIAVRIPARFSGNNSLLIRLLSLLNTHQPGFSTLLPSELEIQSKTDIIDNGQVLVFGSNETLRSFAAIVPGRISGYGDSIAVSIGTISDIKNYAPEIVRDFFSMRQSGCMSARVFYLWAMDADDLPLAIELLANEAALYRKLLTTDDIAALNGEAIRLRIEASAKIVGSLNTLPIVVGAWDSDISAPTAFVANKAFIIPVIATIARDETSFVNNLKSSLLSIDPTSLLLTSAERIANSGFVNLMKNGCSYLSFRRFGAAQCPKLSGFHEGRPFFSTNL